MAVEPTPRLRLPRYTSDSDVHPAREDFNERMDLLDEAVALARQGPREERPLPSTRGTLWLETDTRLLWFDTGTEWVRVVRIGNDGPGRPVAVGGDGSEGNSEWAARADHTHPLPLASSDAPGAMSSEDKELLDGATHFAGPATVESLVRRSNGRYRAAGPVDRLDVANKAYVDDATANKLTYNSTVAVRDANDLTESGDYVLSSSSTNVPTSDLGLLEVRRVSFSALQRWTTMTDTPRTFMRRGRWQGGNWEAWYELARV